MLLTMVLKPLDDDARREPEVPTNLRTQLALLVQVAKVNANDIHTIDDSRIFPRGVAAGPPWHLRRFDER